MTPYSKENGGPLRLNLAQQGHKQVDNNRTQTYGMMIQSPALFPWTTNALHDELLICSPILKIIFGLGEECKRVSMEFFCENFK